VVLRRTVRGRRLRTKRLSRKIALRSTKITAEADERAGTPAAILKRAFAVFHPLNRR